VQPPAPRIEAYRFGRISIDGRAYTGDLIICPDGIRTDWWRPEGHSLRPLQRARRQVEGRGRAAPDLLAVTARAGHSEDCMPLNVASSRLRRSPQITLGRYAERSPSMQGDAAPRMARLLAVKSRGRAESCQPRNATRESWLRVVGCQKRLSTSQRIRVPCGKPLSSWAAPESRRSRS